MVKTILSIVTMVAIACVLCVGVLGGGAVAQAEDFVWDGAGIGDAGPEQDWVNATMWTANSGHPDGTDDNATLADVTSTALVGLDDFKSINDLDITGDSPTKMTFNIKDGTLEVTNFILNDYAELDVDQDVEAHGPTSTMFGDIFIDVAAGKTAEMGKTVAVLGIGSISATLSLDTNLTGTFFSRFFEIHADDNDPDANRGFKLRASGSTMTVTDTLTLRAGQGSTGTAKAKLWNAGGRLFIESGDADNPAVLDIDGGNAPAREAQLDLDDTLAADETQATGNIRMDVGGPTAYMGKYTINGPSLIKLTGAGKAVSGPRP